MKKSKSHKINEKGIGLFRSAIPDNWIANEQHKDYGKDFLVEIGEHDGQLSGDSFYVQLKSQEVGKRSCTEEFISVKLQSKHARYFSKIKDLPVFLVVADLSKHACYYVFLQPLLRNDTSWNHKKEITIRIPTGNDISRHNVLSEAIIGAKEWLRQRHPLTFDDAVAAKKAAIMEIDSRFDPSVSYIDGRTEVTLAPKEAVKFTLTLASEGAKKRLEQCIETGKPAIFESNEIEVAGTKLVESFPPKKIELLPGTNTATLVFSDNERLAESSFRSCELQSIVHGGTKSIRFHSKCEQSPLEVEFVFDSRTENSVSLKIEFDPSVWEGVPICELPYFFPVNEIYSFLSRYSCLYVHFIKQGNLIGTERVNVQSDTAIMEVGHLLNDIEKAKSIFKRFNKNPKWSLDAFLNVGIEVNQSFDLIEKGVWRGVCPNAEATLTGDFSGQKIDQLQHKSCKLVSGLSLELLGETIDLGRVVQEFSEMSVVEIGTAARAGGNPGSNQCVPLKLRASANCKHTMRLADEGE